ncbi:MAG TPA: hypothetical protein VJT49_11465 [Amycolatopsis sp.]|uniref:hypothetical protein n=1 Tax=Amycolatopsis sp. TaxID=37632 RepID=UPI002B471339|nr:hypothetical protein [Amycolatopsis sp.]HKS45709.1 hypothetical protein [Amycolatopsis sp.]
MKICLTIDSPGTAPFCAMPHVGNAGQGTGVYWAAEAVPTTGLRRVANGTSVFGPAGTPLNVDLPSLKQRPIHVPLPPQERSP